MVRGPNGRRHRYVPRIRRRRRGLRRGRVLPMLAVALSPWAFKKKKRRVYAKVTKKRKAVTFALDWDEQYEAVLCSRCRDHMQTHDHGELCGRCGAIFTINRPWSLPELKIHHGVAHGTLSPVLEKCLTRSQSTQTTRIVADGQCGSDQCCQ